MPRLKPSLSTYCRCGAQWHGRYAIDNKTIRDHEKACGLPIGREMFVALGFTDKAPKPDPPSKTNLARWRKKQERP